MLKESGEVSWLADTSVRKSLQHENCKMLGIVIISGYDGHIISWYWNLGLRQFRHNTVPIDEEVCSCIRNAVL